MKIKLSTNKRGPGYWKFNSKFTEDTMYILLVKEISADCLTGYDDLNHRSKWELFKIYISEASIKFGVARAKQKKEYVNQLQHDIDLLNKLEITYQLFFVIVS